MCIRDRCVCVLQVFVANPASILHPKYILRLSAQLFSLSPVYLSYIISFIFYSAFLLICLSSFILRSNLVFYRTIYWLHPSCVTTPLFLFLGSNIFFSFHYGSYTIIYSSTISWRSSALKQNINFLCKQPSFISNC